MIEQIDTRYGQMWVPDTDNGQYWWLKTTGASPEDEMIELARDIIAQGPGGSFIDCGANFGCWTMGLHQAATAVLAIEPQPVVHHILERTIAANQPNKIKALNIAVGEHDGWAEFPHVNLDEVTNFGGISQDRPHPEQPSAPMLQVPMFKLDYVLLWEGMAEFTNPALIKIDCEGAEQRIIRGAEAIIRARKPVLIVEADHPLTDTNALGNQIQALGYNVEILQDNNFIAMPV